MAQLPDPMPEMLQYCKTEIAIEPLSFRREIRQAVYQCETCGTIIKRWHPGSSVR